MGEARRRKKRQEAERAAAVAAAQREIETRLTPALQAAKAQVGVLLPGVDPTIGEIVIASLQANPEEHPAVVLTALALQAPSAEVAVELVTAGFELVLCREKGHMAWVHEKSADFLVGVRKELGSSAMLFGVNRWPMAALLASSPVSATIKVPKGARQVWMACTGLDGAVVRQSEAIALGNAMIERFGGRIVEDRKGPEVLRSSTIEQRMTDRARLRAQAAAQLVRMELVEPSAGPRVYHARVALAEAYPGTLEPGLRVHPEGSPEKVYVVDSRVNESWVLLIAAGPGARYNLEAGAVWVAEGRPVVDGDDPAVGFTDDAAVAAEPPVPQLVLPALGQASGEVTEPPEYPEQPGDEALSLDERGELVVEASDGG